MAETLSNKDFEKIFDRNVNPLRIYNKIIPDPAFINLNNRKFKTCVLVNCIFESEIHFKMDGGLELKLTDCQFNDDLKISSEKELNKDQGSSLKIYNCKCSDVEIEKVSLYESYIRGSHTNDLLFKNIFYTGKTSFNINKCEIKDNLLIENVEINAKFLLSHCTIKDDLDIESSKIRSLTLESTRIGNDFGIEKCDINLYFDGLVAEGITSIIDGKISMLHIETSTFQKHFAWYFSEDWKPSSEIGLSQKRQRWVIESIFIQSSAFNGRLDINLDWNHNQYIQVKQAEFVCTSSSKGDVFMGNLQINRCRFIGFNKDSVFVFNNCLFGTEAIFYQFINFGKLVFNGKTWTAETNVFIQESVLGSTNFIGVDFNNTATLNFYDSDISNISYSSTTWKDKIEKFIPRLDASGHPNRKETLVQFNQKKEDDEIFFTNRRELYRQLKNAAERQNDRIQALKFQQLEMESYRKTLSTKSGSSPYDRLILAFEWTNAFGQNWVRPILFALLGSLAFSFVLTCQLNGQIEVNPLFKTFFQILNPIYSTEKLANTSTEIPVQVWAVAYLQKLWMAFFIVQTVSAFRKFVKK